MALHSTQERSDSAQWVAEDEIDLSRYFLALQRRWLEIVLVTAATVAITALGVWIYRSATPPVFEAVATAAIVRTTTDVVLDQRFTTTSAAEEPGLDANSRRVALIALVDNGTIAQQVIQELGETLPPKLRDPAELLDAVEGEMGMADAGWGQSDLINIKVKTDSPITSAAVANAWAGAYVQQVNRVYGKVPDEMLGTVAAQLTEARQSYKQAQAALEQHLASSKLGELVRQSATISQSLDVLQAAQVDAITGADNHNRSQLRMYYDQWLRTNSLLTAARALGDQLNAGEITTGTATAALALQVLQVQMVNAAAVAPPAWAAASQAPAGLPALEAAQEPQQQQVVQLQVGAQQPQAQPGTTLQLQLDGRTTVGSADLQAQVAAAIAGLEAQLALLESSIDQAAQSLAAGSGTQAGSEPAGLPLASTMANLEQQQRGLQAAIEVENAATLDLTEQRNLAWESVQALSNKQAEMLLARAADNSEVRLSSAAVPLNRTTDQVSMAVSLVLAGVGGLLLGIVVALGLEAANVPPLRSRRAVA